MSFAGKKIGETGAKHFGKQIIETKGLEQLILNMTGNKIGENGAIALFSSIKDIKTLVKLDMNISNNSVESGCAKTICTCMENLINL